MSTHQPALHHTVAVALATLLSVGIAVDTVVAATTGDHTFITDDDHGSTASSIAMSVLIGAAFAALAWVATAERAAFARGNRAVRVVRPVLVGSLALLAVGQVVLHPLAIVTDTDSGTLYDVSTALAGLAMLAFFGSLLVLGVALLQSNPLGVGGSVLRLVLPAIAVVVLLAVVAPSVASPALLTAVALVGLSLVGVAPRRAVVEQTRVAAHV